METLLNGHTTGETTGMKSLFFEERSSGNCVSIVSYYKFAFIPSQILEDTKICKLILYADDSVLLVADKHIK